MDIIFLILRLFLFGVFALAGVGKLMDIPGSVKAVRGFGVPEALARPIGIGLPIFEIILALSFLFVSTSWFGAIGAVLLIAAFLAGMIYQIAQGNAPDCHCFGQIHSEPVGKSSLIRNGVFGAAALLLAIQGRDGQGAAIVGDNVGMTLVLILILVMLAVAVFYLKQILEQQGEILRRIDLLEVSGGELKSVERREAVPPTAETLAIGTPFPEFELTDLAGKTYGREDIFTGAKPVLMFFISPDCAPCKILYPKFIDWNKSLGPEMDLVFVSTGSLEANRERFGESGLRVLVQNERELADKLHARWTPAAIFVNSDGRIASFVSSGDKSVAAMVEEVAAREKNAKYPYVVKENGNPFPYRVGEKVAEFTAVTAEGNEVTHQALSGQKTLAVFWGLSCPHCSAMQEPLAEWENSRGADDPRLMVFTEGEPEAIRELGFDSPVVWDKDYEVSRYLGMWGTPSAVLIDEDGVVASTTASGADKIWALIGK